MKKLTIFLWLLALPFLMKSQTTANFIAINTCTGDSLTLVSTSTSSNTIISYEWDLDADGNFNDASGDTVKLLVNPGIYNYGHRIVTDVGGSNAIYKQVEVGATPAPDFTWTVPCFGDSTEFTNTTSIAADSIINLLWRFGDGFETDLLENPRHQYPAPGNYDVTLRALTNKGCVDSVTKTVQIFATPVITFSFSGDTVFFEGSSVSISVDQVYIAYTWSNGETGDEITVMESGNYSVEVLDLNGCTNTKSVQVIALKEEQLIPMTVITPNSDGMNDYWYIENIDACDNTEVTIFNRWGDEIYSSSNYANDWDGTYDGNPLPVGTYYYVIKCNEYAYKGAVNILK